MRKFKIFISIHYLEIGGAETSLIGLLHSFDYNLVDVDLFVGAHQGPLMKFIPKEVNLLPEIKRYSVIEKPIVNSLRYGYIDIVLAKCIAKFKYWFFRKANPSKLKNDIGIYQYIANAVTPLLNEINHDVNYDLALNFCGMQNFVLDKVKSTLKLAWIHTDYSMIDTDRDCDLRLWDKFDNIISISEDVTKSFLKIYPSLAPKIRLIENILSPDFISSKAEEFDARKELDCSKTIFLSIGRYSSEKNFESIPEILRNLFELGLKNIIWYIIGYGPDEALIREKIDEFGMQGDIALLGMKENPYPYLMACDYYIQPSKFEGKSVAVREAQILKKIVIVTNYPTSSSQINDGKDGIIVPLDNRKCAEGIKNAIENTELQSNIKKCLNTMDYGNVSEVNKLYDLLFER